MAQAISILPTRQILCVRYTYRAHCIVFKSESEQKHEENFFVGVFLQKPKTRFFGDENKIVLKLKFKIDISAFVLYCKRKLNTYFQKKYWYLSPLEFFENENFDVRAPKLRIWTSKIMPDLWLVDLFCPIKKKFHTPP